MRFEAALLQLLLVRSIDGMYDVYLKWGTDLLASSSGDLALADASEQINQRLLRRLLTNAGDYVWNLNYGGGLASYVGSGTDAADIEAAIRAQMALEAAVPTMSAPSVKVQSLDATGGYVSATVTYADPSSGGLVDLNVVTN